MISVPALKSHLRVTSTAEDGYIADLEQAAVAYVERQTGLYFGGEESITYYLTGDGTSDLFLPDDVKAGATITINERSLPGGAATVITEGSDSGWLERTRQRDSTRVAKLVRKGGYGWTRGYEYEVTCTRGYDADTEPADIQDAVRKLVGHWFEQRLPVVTGTITSKVPIGVQETLLNYRRRPWA